MTLRFFILYFLYINLHAIDTYFVVSENFKNISNHVLDSQKKTINFNPKKVNTGDIIFLATNSLRIFVNIYKKIKKPYILITHDSDANSPGKYHAILNHQNLFHWFGENPSYKHPKLTPIPLGPHQFGHLKNSIWGKEYYKILKEGPYSSKKNINVLCNFSTKTFPAERKKTLSHFKNKPYVTIHYTGKNVCKYLNDLKKTKFVLNPRGGGLDCHRTWEALAVGCIPITITSLLDDLFENLPILIIKNWEEVNEKFLEQKYKDLMQKKYNYKKLNFNYWKNIILKKQREIKLIN